MTVLNRTLYPALVAGTAAGVLLFIFQMWTTGPVLHQAERYEKAAATAPSPAHPEEPSDDPLVRTTYTATGDVLLGVGFGMLLTAMYTLTGRTGSFNGLLWGIAGYATFHLGPGLVVPPSIPALELAPLGIRQSGWLFAAFCTALGLALLAFGRSIAKLGGLLLLVMPYLLFHWFVAPSGSATASPLLATLEQHFAMYVLGNFLLFWIVLGTLSGHLYKQTRHGESEAVWL